MSSSSAIASVAVVGAGLAGLACARELERLSLRPVVFEAQPRVGGRCSSRRSPVGVFDDAAQVVPLDARQPRWAPEPVAGVNVLNPWSLPAPAGRGDDEPEFPQLRCIGLVGVPSMQSLADALAAGIEVRPSTPIVEVRRGGRGWALRSSATPIDETFDALVLAAPAPQMVPLAQHSAIALRALGATCYRGRWVMLLGSGRPLGLAAYREFDGGPIERIAAIHAKPGRRVNSPQERWFVEADAHWSTLHELADEDTVAERLLANLNEHAQREIAPNFLAVHRWSNGLAQHASGAAPGVLWDSEVRLGVCGDSVVESRIDEVVGSGISVARRVAADLRPQRPLRPRLKREKVDARAPLLSSFTDRADKRRRMVLIV
jgi:renalase